MPHSGITETLSDVESVMVVHGISFEEEKGKTEEMADIYAQNMLIDPVEYKEFIRARRYDAESIKRFAEKIDRDPGIVLGRLQNDGRVGYSNKSLNSLKHKYKVVMI